MRLIYKLLFPTLIVIILINLLVGMYITNFVETEATDRHIKTTAHSIQQMTPKHITAEDFNNGDPDVFQEYMDAIKSEEVLKIKAFDTDSKIIFSTDKDNIGMIADNPDYDTALTGIVVSEINSPEKERSNKDLEGFDQVIEVYVPISYDGKIKGVIEVYYDLDTVNEEIKTTKRLVMINSGILTFTGFLSVIIMMYLVILRPISRFKRELKDNQPLSVNSDDELGDLARSFESLRNKISKSMSRIKSLLEQKNHFMNRLAHDIKSPLTPIITMAQLLGKKVDDPNEKKKAQIIERNAKYMLSLIQDTLHFIKSDNSRNLKDMQHVKISKIVSDIILLNQVQIDEQNIKVKNQIKDTIGLFCEELKIKEALNNLLINAMKFVPKNKGIITFGSDETDEKITIYIKDNGIGIQKKDLDDIFKEYYQVNKIKVKESHGLGLSIVKKIVESHKGRIWAESDGTGKGTIFFIEFLKKK
ncbi:hypothetical protein COV93_02420 [Candidatus Woesearchaeota archaeon CG11_big_fil_rev_8_21_14_0_20_43_8]|nr:MAG: hypothetical protein COV93_02420 [Candidatus Woesearchaeota archaeon CG11_big_fil_rev_8_21_14_0_20_43_8]PIO06776.1 MAG: hypothetical protein COT47_02755 [Candidatus Woesearchaeota archaeon CG08_land_8_20_14_0_20_43_7]